jgi:Ca2+-binding RTX toxin-like protein
VKSLGGNDLINAVALNANLIALTADGGDGNDVIIGSAGNDTLLGGAQDDILIGAAGTDQLNGGAGHNIVLQ